MAETVEINDFVFCKPHFKEVCTECSYDGREDNDAFYGLDPIDREAIPCPDLSTNKDGVYQCKKHGSQSCNLCFNWKKMVTRAHTAAKKAGRK